MNTVKLIKLNKWEYCDYCHVKQYKGRIVRIVGGEFIQCLICKVNRQKQFKKLASIKI